MIATVLLMAITVLLASAAYLMIDDAIAAPDKGAPYATMSVRALDNGFQVVRFTELSQNLHTSGVSFSIVPLLVSMHQVLLGMSTMLMSSVLLEKPSHSTIEMLHLL